MVKGRNKYIGRNYVKECLREYSIHVKMPHKSRLKPFQERAIKNAIEQTKTLSNGSERLKMINMVLVNRTHTIEGAAFVLNFSSSTCYHWHREFVDLVADFLDLI